MRDHPKLRAFELPDQLAVLDYKVTTAFPRDEAFGLTSQLRRAAVSAASNIVEGCACGSSTDYWRFLDVAHGSAREVEYQRLSGASPRISFRRRQPSLKE